MPNNAPSLTIRRFLGLRNKARDARLPEGALTLASNVDLDDTGGIERRQGYESAAAFTNVTAAFGTRDEKRLFVVDDGTLYRVHSLAPLVRTALATGIGGGAIDWADTEGYAFCTGAVQLVLGPDDSALPFSAYGADGALLEAQGQQLPRDEADIGTLSAPADGECIAFFQGAVWMSVYDSGAGISWVFRSKPFQWGKWDFHTDNIPVPGRVVLLTDAPGALVIGTDRAVHLYSGGAIARVADYAAIGPRSDHDTQGGIAYFWTARGLCRATPFENMTDANVSVDPGEQCAVGLLRTQGVARALVIATGTAGADNPY